MAESNPLEILLKHDRWATRNMLDACAPLSHEQLHRRFEMGRGSVHDTTAHIIGAMRRWQDMLAGRPDRPRIDQDGMEHSIAELIALHEQIAEEFAQLARGQPLDGVITAERGGKKYAFTRGAILVHVTTHGMHHRAQCLNMLRHLGVSPLPLSSVLEWIRTVDGAER
jgi:uncharacterized damage-inducible protein DinB